MEKPKITEGEWNISASGHPDFKHCIISPDGGSVCHITNWTDHFDNAQAISAVPDMIDALIEAKNTIKVFEDNNPMNVRGYSTSLISINKALKKAGCK